MQLSPDITTPGIGSTPPRGEPVARKVEKRYSTCGFKMLNNPDQPDRYSLLGRPVLIHVGKDDGLIVSKGCSKPAHPELVEGRAVMGSRRED